jgi:hypothetical protein
LLVNQFLGLSEAAGADGKMGSLKDSEARC